MERKEDIGRMHTAGITIDFEYGELWRGLHRSNPLSFKRPYSFLVYKDRDKYMAEDWRGRIRFEDDDASEVINSVLDNGYEFVFIRKDEYIINSTLNAKSGIRLVSDGAVLKKGSDVLLLKIKDVEDFWIVGFTLDGNFIDGNHIVYCNNCKRVRILENKFVNPPSDMFMLTFQVTPSYYCEVRGNYFDGSGVTGCDAFAGVPFKSVIKENYIKDAPSGGITSGVMNDVIIESNIIDNPKASGISIDAGTDPSRGVVIKNNAILNTGENGINLGWSRDYPIYDAIVEGNYIYKPSRHGISVYCGRKVQIIGNTIIEARYDGIVVRGVDDVIIQGNMVIDPNAGENTKYRDGDGIVFFSDKLTGYGDDRTHFTIVDNIVKDERSTPLMLLGISLHLDTSVPTYPRKGRVVGNIIEGSKEEAIALVNEAYQTKSFNFSDYEISVRRNYGFTTENSGVATFSGDGSTTEFKIKHGLVSTPSKYGVSPLTPDADALRTITVDDTYITITFDTAPPSGTDNVKFGWWAEV